MSETLVKSSVSDVFLFYLRFFPDLQGFKLFPRFACFFGRWADIGQTSGHCDSGTYPLPFGKRADKNGF